MKNKRFPLHIQILAALILGVVFGTIFSIEHDNLKVHFYKDSEIVTRELTEIDELALEYSNIENETITEEFKTNNANVIIKRFNTLNRKKEISLTLIAVIDGKIHEIKDIHKIEKHSSIATWIKPIGTIFIRLLSFLAIPLVIASLILGAASLDDVKKIGRIGLKTFSIYVLTTAVAITIGLTAANIIEPGKQIDNSTKQKLLGEYQDDNPINISENVDIDIIDFFVGIVPKNPINAMAEGNMVQIVFFAVIFGITLTFIEKRKSGVVIQFFEGVSETMIKMVNFIMKIAPYGVFALISATIAEFGFGIITTLAWYIFAVIIGLLIHSVVTYSLIIKSIGHFNIRAFFKGIRNAQAIGFSTSSSAATLPVTIDCVENNLGVKKQVSGFVLPLGATINMDGTALYQGVAAVFIAQVYGFDLNIAQQLTIVLTAVLASIGTAPVPGVGIIMLVMILNAINIPAEGIALILGVDRILDMCRTITNVTGDAAVAVAINGSEMKK